jgi:hypothetical protein
MWFRGKRPHAGSLARIALGGPSHKAMVPLAEPEFQIVRELTDPLHNPVIPHVIVLERRKELFYPYGKTYVQTLGEQD